MTVETIKDLIEHLSPDDQAALADWIGARDKRTWDTEIERDFSQDGRGSALLKHVDDLIDAGDVTGFRISRPHGLGE
jgi:hypothetical protein